MAQRPRDASRQIRRGCGHRTTRSSSGTAARILDGRRLGAADSDRADAERSARVLAAAGAAAGMTAAPARPVAPAGLRDATASSSRRASACGSSSTSRWARSRCCCAYVTWWQAALFAGSGIRLQRRRAAATRRHAPLSPGEHARGYSAGMLIYPLGDSGARSSSSPPAPTSSPPPGGSSRPATAWPTSPGRVVGRARSRGIAEERRGIGGIVHLRRCRGRRVWLVVPAGGGGQCSAGVRARCADSRLRHSPRWRKRSRSGSTTT